MDSTGVAGVGQYNVNLTDMAVIKKQAAKETAETPAAAPMPDVADAAALSEKLKAYIILADQSAGGGNSATSLTEAAVKSENLVDNLIGTRPLFPFDNGFMDVYNEFAKRYLNGEVKITSEEFDQIKQQVEKLSSALGAAKPAVAKTAASEPAPAAAPAAKPVAAPIINEIL